MDLSIFNDLEITNLKGRDKIQMLLEQIRNEDEEFMEILVGLKCRMHVTWYQPWYQRTGWLTRKLEQNEDENEQFHTDKINKAECQRIHHNWVKFVKINQFVWQDGGVKAKKILIRNFVILYLARRLERNLHQVFQHFVACYSGPNRGPYTKDEVKIIEMCMYHFPKDAIQYSARLLSREARGIQTRVNESAKGKVAGKEKVKWTLLSATKFLKLLMQYSGLPLEELKYKQFERPIWVKLENKMDKTVRTLQKFWYYYLHVQIFVKCDIKMKKLRKKIFKLIQTYPFQVWSDIRWQELVKHFPDGVTSGFLYNISVKVAVLFKNYLKTAIEDVLQFMLRTIRTYPEKRLKTLILNNDGMLEIKSYQKI